MNALDVDVQPKRSRQQRQRSRAVYRGRRTRLFLCATPCHLTDSALIEDCSAFLQKLVTFDFGDQTFHFFETEIPPLLS
jgi:hypothetical protein